MTLADQRENGRRCYDAALKEIRRRWQEDCRTDRPLTADEIEAALRRAMG